MFARRWLNGCTVLWQQLSFLAPYWNLHWANIVVPLIWVRGLPCAVFCRTTHVRALTLSMLNRAWYWGTTALRGSVKIRTSVSSSRLCRGTTTGRRPTNSGIIPNSIRSLASTSLSSLSFSSISATVSVSPLVLAKSAAAAARRPFPRLEGVPKPRYLRVMKQGDQVRGRNEDKQEFWLTTCGKSLHTSSVKIYLFVLSSADDSVKSIEGTRCNKQDVCCVDLHRFSSQLPGVFLRNIDDRAFQEFKQPLTDEMKINTTSLG